LKMAFSRPLSRNIHAAWRQMKLTSCRAKMIENSTKFRFLSILSGQDRVRVNETDKLITTKSMVAALPFTAALSVSMLSVGMIDIHALKDAVEAVDPILANSDVGYYATRFLQIVPPLCAQFLFASALQAIMQFRQNKTTGKLSGLAPASMAVNCTLWSTYGFLVAHGTSQICDWTITLPNLSGLALGCVYSYFYQKYCPPGAFNKYLLGGGAVFLTLGGASAVLDPLMLKDAVGYTAAAAAVVLMASPLATIKTVIEEKSTAALPLIPSIAVLCNASTWTCYGLLVVHDPVIWVPNGLGLTAGLVQMGCYATYGLPPPEK